MIHAPYLLISTLFMVSMAFVSPIFAFYLTQKGLDPVQIGISHTAFAVGLFLFELPTGILADRFGRKISFLVAAMMTMIACALFLIIPTFWGVITAQLFMSLGVTAYSGALEAWVVDDLRRQGREGEVNRLFSQEGVVRNAASMVIGLVGGYAAAWNLNLPWLLAGLTIALSLILALRFMQEPPRATEDHHRSVVAWLSPISVAWKAIRHDWRLAIFLLTTFFLSFSIRPVDMFWQLRVQELGDFSPRIFGWLWVGFSLFQTIGSFLVGRVKGTGMGLLMGLSILLGGTIITGSFATGITTLYPALLVFYGLYSFMMPLRRTYLNDLIPSEARATLISANQFILFLSGSLSASAGGALAKASIPIAWQWAAVIGLLNVIVYPILARTKTGSNRPVQGAEHNAS